MEKKMFKEHKRNEKMPALMRQRENNSRPKKRKISEIETPRKRRRVSDMAGSSSSYQEQMRTRRMVERKMKEEAEECSPKAKRKKMELEQDQSKESCCSTDVSAGIRKRNPKRKMEDLEEPPTRRRMKMVMEEEQEDSQRAAFLQKYVELHLLGDGGFGSVFAGYRLEGKLPVAIKHIPKDKVVIKHKDENGSELPMELVIMLKLASETVPHSAILSLLDWYDLDQELILVMERPMFAEDLLLYLNERGNFIEESEAKVIIKQLVEAAVYLQNANIFHRDLKVDNVLIDSSSEDKQIYLIDFGLSCFDDGKQHELLCGTPGHIPLDWMVNSTYRAGPTTAWQLGVVLFEMLHMTRFNINTYISNNLTIWHWLSDDCMDFLSKCLIGDPEDRPTLEELLCHPWLS
ncbi:PREDICTED: serine/threonine-protein kinase pim-2-like [Poecilia mexicana]|uniref:serine/threonine-protein kinase pim-2-like n=1 Tax=Poecilia mexicana TaxID=48701 RepID=UPI00072E54EF|nr:PREDICTED: serine/threonine-protein kinase pim-2-like [Poecilia mexicana]